MRGRERERGEVRRKGGLSVRGEGFVLRAGPALGQVSTIHFVDERSLSDR